MATPSFDQQVTFLYVNDLECSTEFYEKTMGLPLVLDQGGCRIYRVSGDGFLGICRCREGRSVSRDGVVFTFVTDEVDGWHERLRSGGMKLDKAPAFNPAYNIYHFFFRDPDGHLLEIQRFEDARWPRLDGAKGG